MRRIVVTEFVSLDGVMQDPDGSEGTSQGGWAFRYGPQVVATVRGASPVSVFLDLKLHDIPVTVAGAARAVSRLRPDVLTVHAVGGADVIRAAVEAAPGTMVAAVTVLTSLGDDDLGQIGMTGPVPVVTLRQATRAVRRLG